MIVSKRVTDVAGALQAFLEIGAAKLLLVLKRLRVIRPEQVGAERKAELLRHGPRRVGKHLRRAESAFGANRHAVAAAFLLDQCAENPVSRESRR
jgi:hypothetical protein